MDVESGAFLTTSVYDDDGQVWFKCIAQQQKSAHEVVPQAEKVTYEPLSPPYSRENLASLWRSTVEV